jgi:hypothetical protein
VSVTVKARRALARRPWIYWPACLAVAAAVATLVAGHVARLDDARRRWATSEPVLVATIDHLPGDELTAELVEMPLAVVPPDAVGSNAVSGEAIVRQRVARGEVVVAADLTALRGPASLADRGTLVVGITDPLARDIRIGLDVQVVAEGIVLADRARVVGLVDEVVYVAVEARAAATVAAAAHDATAGIVFIP